MRNKLIARVRRDNHNIACRTRELDTILNGLSAPFDNVGDARWDHAARLCHLTGSEFKKSTGQDAQRGYCIAAEHTHVSERKFAFGKHCGLDHARQDVDSLLLTFLFNEACLIVVVVLCGRLRLFGMFVLWFHLGSTWPACPCGSKYSGASSNCSMPPSPRATPTLGIEDSSKTGLFASALKC